MMGEVLNEAGVPPGVVQIHDIAPAAPHLDTK